MNVTLRQDSEQFIDQLVREGRYATAAEVLEAALSRLRQDAADGLDEDDWVAIRESEDQIARGQVRNFNDAAAILRQKHLGR